MNARPGGVGPPGAGWVWPAACSVSSPGSSQATIGYRIPEWTGAKAAPVALGAVDDRALAAGRLAAVRQRRAGLSVWGRAVCALGLIGPGLLCLSTVGRLWYPPAVLLWSPGC